VTDPVRYPYGYDGEETWDDGPTSAYHRGPVDPPGIPLMRRLTPVPLAEGLGPSPWAELPRDLIVGIPWGITVGIVCARFGQPLWIASLSAVGIALIYERWLRRFV
jgi:hypothetical protein